MLTCVFCFPRKQVQVCFTDQLREDHCFEPFQLLLIQITWLMPAHRSCHSLFPSSGERSNFSQGVKSIRALHAPLWWGNQVLLDRCEFLNQLPCCTETLLRSFSYLFSIYSPRIHCQIHFILFHHETQRRRERERQRGTHIISTSYSIPSFFDI